MHIAIDLSHAALDDIAQARANPCVALAQAMVRVDRGHTFYLILNDDDTDSIMALRSLFAGVLPRQRVRSWPAASRLVGDGGRDPSHHIWASEASALLRAGLLADLAVGPVLIPVPDALTGPADTPNALNAVVSADCDFDEEALRQIQRCENLWAMRSLPTQQPTGRPTLAFVSPLPPERSGIADYSAQLLPALAKFYDVDVIIDQAELSEPWVRANCGVRDVNWLLTHAQQYDRVMYHFGNSSYHQHMFDLLRQVPGVVVLHDFFLGDIYNYLEVRRLVPDGFSQALYKSHGYAALMARSGARDASAAITEYPANLAIAEQSLGVIVHSEHARQLAEQWYSKELASRWHVVGLPRARPCANDRRQARQRLGFAPDEFVVCSFGLMGATKLNQRLLEAWLLSPLAQDERCRLVFVGEEDQGRYGAGIRAQLQSGGLAHRVRLTGWADAEVFQSYLTVADLAVQLRANSRGETSAAVLDCMNYGVPTIVNGHGAFAELPADAVCMLPDAFDNQALADAMTSLWRDATRRATLAARARAVVGSDHSPENCAQQYVAAIEQAYASAAVSERGLVLNLARLHGHAPSDTECLDLARAVVQTLSRTRAHRQLLVDVSATARQDLKTGIQRVVRALVQQLIAEPPTGFRVEPVYLTEQGGAWHYRYAREWTAGEMGLPTGVVRDEPVDRFAGDVMLVADFTAGYAVEAEKAGVFSALRRDGIRLDFCVFDLLPMQRPEFFPPGQFGFLDWINTVVRSADGAICISKAVAEDLTRWVSAASVDRKQAIDVDWFHLGADIESSIPSKGLPQNAKEVLSAIAEKPSFLMVGTIEPRKGYLQALEAFTLLWEEGHDINLVIIGREGWRGLPDSSRRTIPQTMNCLRRHDELGKRLLWLEDASDEYLDRVYSASSCLIAASEAEGFGLPLIEAAQRKLPILARDIPVFREVAADHAYYFEGLAPEALANSVTHWLRMLRAGKAPTSVNMPWLSWRQSTDMLLARLDICGR